ALSASAVLLRNAKTWKNSDCRIGSYLCVWHWAQAIDVPIHTVNVVFTRSTTATLRNSSSLVPPSLLVSVLRWNAVATSWSSVGWGSRSPAICSTVNTSNGLLSLSARITQSRYFQIVRGGSSAYPAESAYRARSSHIRAQCSPTAGF